MSMIDIILKMPCWYIVFMAILTLFYAYRGVLYVKIFGVKHEEQLEVKDGQNIKVYRKLRLAERIIIDYIQEILFKVVITVSSFIALYLSHYILSLQKEPFNEISTGTSALIIFLFIWGIIGISGYLTHLIVLGKLPNK